jgi:hypothetical protein
LNDFPFGSTTKGPTNKWRLEAELACQIGLESVLADLLILVWWCYILQKRGSGGDLESHQADGKAYTHRSIGFRPIFNRNKINEV